jgi:nucleotide-binding universal stress UspA family protein
MLKYILVSATGGVGDDIVFDAALKLARPFEAHLEFLHARLDVTEVLVSMATGGMGLGTGAMDQGAIDRMEADAKVLQSKARLAVESFCAANDVRFGAVEPEAGVTANFTAEVGSISRWIAEHGRFADMIVVGGPQPGREAAREAQEAALMESGRPTLIVPAAVPANLLSTVVIAWKDTPEAARAITAAMPLIDRADRVVVVSVDEQGDTAAADTADQLLRSLKWHNKAADVRHVAAAGRKPVAAMLDEAHALNASLLVMGGYSHSRLREVLFGGFTQTVLDGIDRPVLIMH